MLCYNYIRNPKIVLAIISAPIVTRMLVDVVAIVRRHSHPVIVGHTEKVHS